MKKKPKTKTRERVRPPVKPAPVQTMELAIRGADRLPEIPEVIDAHVLGDDVALGALGLTEVKLTAEEEKVLSEPVPIDEILIKPNKSGVIYLSHPSYTRWFNRAFGRLGWSIVQRGKAQRVEKTVVVPYVMHIHGQPAAFAWGEQDYFDGAVEEDEDGNKAKKNRDQTWGDALESTVASALRRCAKRLGVGLELWDKRFCDKFLKEHGVVVTVRFSRGGTGQQWRRKIDPPFYNEVQPGDRSTKQQEQRQAPAKSSTAAPPSHTQSKEKITEQQRERLWRLVKHVGRDPDEVKDWLTSTYKVESSHDITRDVYDAICSAIESSGPLPTRRN